MPFGDFESYWHWARSVINKRLDRDVQTLHYQDDMRYMLEGGKRIRGTLCLLICQTLGGDYGWALPYASGIEMVHAATLAHDDFVDQHETRRGRSTLYKRLDPRRAVLLADMMLSMAANRIALLGDAEGYQTLSKAIYEICRGAILEPLDPSSFLMELKTWKIPEEPYLVLIRLKTAELFGAACKLGAIATNSSTKAKNDAYRFGIAVGEAYQVADDVADIEIAKRKGRIDYTTAIKLLPTILYLNNKGDFSEFIRDVMHGRDPAVSPSLRTNSIHLKELINVSSQKARDAIARFPDNNYQRILGSAPEAVVNFMLKDVTYS